MMRSGIYRIVHIATDRCYIGQAMDIERRWRDHRRNFKNRTHHNPHLQAAWLAYGKDAFVFEVLEICGVDDLNRVEQSYLDNLQPTFNVAKIAGSRRGVPQSDETKAKQSAALRGKKQPPRSEGFKDSCRTRMLGSRHSDETRAKMSETHRANNIWEGRSHSDASKIKIGIAGRGRKHTDEAKAKIRSATLGRKMSDETKAKLSASRKAMFAARSINPIT